MALAARRVDERIRAFAARKVQDKSRRLANVAVVISPRKKRPASRHHILGIAGACIRFYPRAQEIDVPGSGDVVRVSLFAPKNSGLRRQLAAADRADERAHAVR